MPVSRTPIPSDYRLLYKPIEGVKNGGCSVEIWMPKGTRAKSPYPVALMLHGGGWIIGTADGIPYNQVRYLHEHGVAVASFEYRYTPHAKLDEIRSDLLDGYRYIQTRMNQDLFEAGSINQVDGTRCCVMGWSAGGANTLYLASDATAQKSLPPLRAAIAVYPVTDFDLLSEPFTKFEAVCASDPGVRTAWRELSAQACATSFRVERGPAAEAQTESATDSNPEAELVQAVKASNPAPALARTPPRGIVGQALMASKSLGAVVIGQEPPFPASASPVNLVTRAFPPTCIVVATADKLIPVTQSYTIYDELVRHGVDAKIVECNEMEHGEAECLPHSNWIEAWWEEALRPSLDFAIERMLA